MIWRNTKESPFRTDGFAFFEKDGIYRRMPVNPEIKLPEAVDGLSNETAGGQIRFHGILKHLEVRVRLSDKPLFFDNIKAPHLSDVSKQSLDLYLSKDGREFIFYDVSKNMSGEKEYTRILIDFEKSEEYDFLLNFPTYGAVEEVLIGTDDDAVISESIHKYDSDKKIVIYGSSIQQGACASRPGMATGALLSRWLNTEVYNMGFSSSGRAEDEVAGQLAEIENTAVLVISVEGNCPDSDWLNSYLSSFIDVYRKKNPETPIIIMPFIISGADFIDTKRRKRHETARRIQENIVRQKTYEGDKNIYLLWQESDVENEYDGHSVWHEITVDGLHYNDLGFFATAKPLYRLIKKLI